MNLGSKTLHKKMYYRTDRCSRIFIQKCVEGINLCSTTLHKNLLKALLNILPQRIVYVSCNPATLARDLFELKNFYKVKEIQPVDMFPQTYHIETVSLLELMNG